MQITQIVSALFLSLVAVPTLKAQTEIDELAHALTVKLMAPDLVGGRKAEAGELPLSQWLGFCTATWVSLPGEEKGAVVTAAHCVDNGQSISFNDRQYGTKHNGKCYKHPNYNDNTVQWDYAMCEMSTGPASGAVVASFDANPVKVGDGLLMAGYGRNPNAGTLHLGASVVYAIRGQDIVTNTSIALSSGDSGGVLYRGPTNLKSGPFLVVGINSRRAVGSVQSYFNQTVLATEWIKSWSGNRNLKICGINVSCGTIPDVPDRCLGDKEMIEYFESELRMAKDALAVCIK